MALNTEPKSLWEEIEAAERFRDGHLEGMEEQIRGYHGPHYRESESGGGDYVPENHYHEYVSLTVPRCVNDNPRVEVRSRRGGVNATVAEALRHAMNRWCRDANVQDEFGLAVQDALFRWGVTLVTQEKDPRAGKPEDPEYWPQVTRLSPQRFFMDPLALSVAEARYMGHKWIIDKDDLLDMAEDDPKGGWNRDAINELAEDIGLDEVGRYDQFTDLGRGEVVLYEIWIPEEEHADAEGKDGYNGTIHTLAVSAAGSSKDVAKPKMVRDPRPYYGPRWGPYTVWGVHWVPDSPLPMSPLVAVESQVRDLNQHALSTSESAARYKRMIFVDDRDNTLPEKVASGEHDYVFQVTGMAESAGKSVIGVEVGGITEQQLSYMGVARDRLDRVSGLQDAQRGVVTGRGTATEVNAAMEASTIRTSWTQKRMRAAAEASLRTVAWYLHEDDRVFFPLGEEAAQQLDIVSPVWFGGDMTASQAMKRFGLDRDSAKALVEMLPERQPFDDLELEIELYSMERVSEVEQQNNAMQMTNLIATLAPAIPMNPHIDWGMLFGMLSQAYNMPTLADVVDIEVAQQLAQLQFAAQTGSEQPRLARDTSTGEGSSGPPIRTPSRPDTKGNPLGGQLQQFVQRNTAGRPAPALGQ